jgi:hypothetical protein
VVTSRCIAGVVSRERNRGTRRKGNSFVVMDFHGIFKSSSREERVTCLSILSPRDCLK